PIAASRRAKQRKVRCVCPPQRPETRFWLKSKTTVKGSTRIEWRSGREGLEFSVAMRSSIQEDFWTLFASRDSRLVMRRIFPAVEALEWLLSCLQSANSEVSSHSRRLRDGEHGFQSICR